MLPSLLKLWIQGKCLNSSVDKRVLFSSGKDLFYIVIKLTVNETTSLKLRWDLRLDVYGDSIVKYRAWVEYLII
jgi:hypothetical protein